MREKRFGEETDVLVAFAQRRQAQFDRVEAEQKVAPKCAARDFGGEIGIRRRDQAHVDLQRARRADAFELAVFEHAQQFRLLRQRNVRDLVEKQAAAVGELEAADAVAFGIGERAAHVAEHLRLEHRFRNAAHVDLDQRLARTRGARMQPARDDALAGAVLAEDQHVRIGRRDAIELREHALHRRRFGDEFLVGFVAQDFVFAFQPRRFTARNGQRELVADHAHEALVVPWLLDEIAGAVPHRLDREIDRAPRGHHHDGEIRVELLDLAQEIKAFGARRRVARVVEVDQRRVEALLAERVECRARAIRRRRIDALGFQQQTQRLAHVALVVGDQDVRSCWIRHVFSKVHPASRARARQVTRVPTRLRASHRRGEPCAALRRRKSRCA